ncbi:MAG TPA: hypothetical protein VEQ58_12600, partial [Polyangiaceae bacterium]|nr:hypothetical protein [Polyangiaceae bacterium]
MATDDSDSTGHSGPRAEVAPGDFATAHELPSVFQANGVQLSTTLVEMLNEHYTHRTERRGCGYTQATRVLAALVNRAQPDRRATIEQLFVTPDIERIELALRELPGRLRFEESRLLVALIADLVTPAAAEAGVQQLVVSHQELKVGTCPLAEKYFLEIGDGFVRRKGRINVWVSEAGAPLLLEKLNLGDNHSCISVTGLMLNGVRIPPGCLLGVTYEGEPQGRANRTLPGQVLPVSSCSGFKLLRLTTLAVSPPHRERAFTSHFRSQVEAGLFAPRDTTIVQLQRVAEAQL